MIKLVLDTNIILSAIGWSKGKPRKILNKCIDGELIPIISKDILDEVKTVLKRPKFDFIKKDEREEFLSLFLQYSEMVEPRKIIEVIKEDPADDRIIDCALEGNVDYIITGDNHLLKLKEYKNIKILTPANFLRRLSE